jgi:uncharacterized protein (DUF433 family)
MNRKPSPSDANFASRTGRNIPIVVQDERIEARALKRKSPLRGRNPLRILRLLTPVPATIDKSIDSTRGDLGMGVYSLAQLRLYMALYGKPEDGERVARWLRTVLNPVDHHRWHADYSFSDLISLFVVRQLRRKGVSPATIRNAESYLRLRWKTDRPFAREDIKTDGVEVFCDDAPQAGQIEAAGRRGQQAIRRVIESGLESVRYSDGGAAYWLPSPGIVVDPRVQFGSPVMEGTRVPTDAVAGVARVMGVEQAVRRFDLPLEQVKNAISFEDRIASLD